MFNNLKKMMVKMNEQVCNLSRYIEAVKKNRTEILELKSVISVMTLIAD